jgi:hypothetical protein
MHHVLRRDGEPDVGTAVFGRPFLSDGSEFGTMNTRSAAVG